MAGRTRPRPVRIAEARRGSQCGRVVSRPRRRLLRPLAGVVALHLAGACGGDGVTDPPEPGTFEGSASGGFSHSATGVAVFSAVADGPLAGFDVEMGTPVIVVDRPYSRGLLVNVLRKRGTLPAAGTYPIHDYSEHAALPDDAFGLFAWYYDLNGATWFCTSTAGTLTLSSTSGSRVSGSYRTAARCTTASTSAGPTTVELQGTFDAGRRE